MVNITAGVGLHSLDNTLRLLSAFLIFLLVLAAAWLITKWLAGYQKEQMSGGNIEIMETCRLSQTKYIQIVRVGSRYLVIGICKDTITMLASFDETELKLEKTEKKQETFQEVFQRVKEWNHKKEK